MSLDIMKPFMVVLAVGLLLVIASPILSQDGETSWLGISARFRQLVEECHQQHPMWDRGICEGVVRGDLWVGMTTEMVRATLGEPKQIELPDPDHPAREAWTYYTPYYGKELLQIENGLLIGWGPPPDGCETCGIIRPRP